MKNQVLAFAAVAGLTLGSIAVASGASAQSYGGEQDAPAAETSETAVETDAPIESGIVQIQDADGPETEDEAVDGETNGRRGHRGGCNLEAAAEAIGIDEADLEAAIESGDTIADVAGANGVDVDVVIDAMVDAEADRIAEKVDEGRITQAEADEKLAELEAKVIDRVNGEGGDSEA